MKRLQEEATKYISHWDVYVQRIGHYYCNNLSNEMDCYLDPHDHFIMYAKVNSLCIVPDAKIVHQL